MELIVLKVIGCSAVLIVTYFLFLQKERTFMFNRMLLLTSLIFAYIVPFIQFESPFKNESSAKLIFGEASGNFKSVQLPVQESFDFGIILWWIYGAVSVFMLLRFIYSISKILLIKGEKRLYKNQKLLVTENEIFPFSFLNTIYISRKNFRDNEMDERIFLHEKCHIEEKHSFDVLFLEILKIFSWINPALYFYKKAMSANHEFLADAYVLKNNFNISNYQHLILNEIKHFQSFKLTHQFNFNNTKKRFIMMTSKNSRLVGMKKFLLLPVLAILFVSFTQEKEIQSPDRSSEKIVTQTTSAPGISLVEMQNIPEIIQNTAEKNITKSDTVRKEKLTEAENSLAIPPLPPKPPVVPRNFSGTLPIFPGGINEFRKLIANNFDTSVFKGNEGLIKTTILIDIDENGKMSNIRSIGENEQFNKEAQRTVQSITSTTIWEPAKQDGQPVKYVFRLPLTMEFAAPAVK